jgi:hypothetical protein
MKQMLLQLVEHIRFQNVTSDRETVGAAAIASIAAAVMAGTYKGVASTALTTVDQARE